MVTLAPELDRAFEVAGILSEGSVVVSAGHSGADFETATSALAGPWSTVTHLFNQMSPFHHRAPGLVGAALLSSRPCGLIVDGVHADPAAIRLAWHHLGPDRFVLITDGMQATGLGEGIYLLGDREVFVGPEGPRIGRGILAGSTLTMDRAVANLQQWTTATEDQARACASVNPARILGLEAHDP
jgi:N-acetylglucosamine-6-phosphate deacetylase